ncbi:MULTISPECIES: A/G-specific adenine glycosylase [Legionella]|uniref:A/G-specific adenine glycosylase n=1 Tax=Legionella TaxID=445 RepID=UPI000F8CEE10|nr:MULTISPECIES: A/G-specific adenine glycosylase [Legionella]MCP0913558.1 A/G-specific adenine glycosylase [Legionella sp. 27cVA30]RUQ99785.1 A/G-specific adenine glycosylase [Legionella septentrionalis]RUR11021.1 A/G-specific adenine glycosylase [Legionella septentrionalis]RUR15911.1 A/G-specific adenine glycosylase [Legionella septentrionalis]
MNADIDCIQQQFTWPLLQWYEVYGRKNLPWQIPREAYRVWISEIMLQQTQVKTVIPFFLRFMDSFPNIETLAQAAEDEVLAHWSGLGYYSRARNLHKTAQIICQELQGKFPQTLEELIKLPGIGASTAAAIASLAFNHPTAILDGNVKRVLSRYFLVEGAAEQAAVKNKLWQLANLCMPSRHCAKYTQAIMDLGATCCTVKNPDCSHCPLAATCAAYAHDVVADYPTKKVKKIKPVKHQQFLLLHTKTGLIYLEKLPPVGIWGGLWSTLGIDTTHCPMDYVRKNYPWELKNVQEITQIKHSFSHFHLHISALAVQVELHNKTILAETSGAWFTAAQLTQIGLPKPVSKIIEQFFLLPESFK